MKKLLYVLLALTMAFAMVACPDSPDNGGKVKPNPPAPGTQEDGVVRFLYKDGTWLDIAFTAGDTTWGDIKIASGTGPVWNEAAWAWETKTNVKYKKDTYGSNASAFGGWADDEREIEFKLGGSYATDTTVIEDPLTLTPIWWSLELTASASDSAEKVRLQNATFVVYEFNLGTTALTDITGITASYKVSEAVINYNPETRFRVFGPYFFNGTNKVVEPGTDPEREFWGDFTITEFDQFAARFQASGSPNQTLTDFNKLNPYMINGPTTKLMANDGAAISEARVTVGARSANTWFDVAYLFGGNTGDYSYTQNLANLTASADAHLGTSTSKTKVYFAIGMPVYGDTDVNVDPYDVTSGVIQLIKNVKLTTTSGTINGTIPNLTADGVTSKQVFASYVDPNAYGWRGGVSDTVKVYEGYVPPPPVVIIPDPDLETEVINNPTPNIYGNLGLKADGTQTTTASEVDRAIISLDGDGYLVFDVKEFDFNTGQKKTGFVKESNPYFGLGDPDDATDGEGNKDAWLEVLEALGEVDPDDLPADFWDEFDYTDYDVASEFIYVEKDVNGVWGGGGVWYELPANFREYTTLRIEYTATVSTGSAGASDVFYTDETGTTAATLTYATTQMSPKRGQNSFANMNAGGKYWSITTGTANFADLTIATEFAAGDTAGISFQVNAYSNDNVPVAGKFKVSKITLIP